MIASVKALASVSANVAPSCDLRFLADDVHVDSEVPARATLATTTISGAGGPPRKSSRLAIQVVFEPINFLPELVAVAAVPIPVTIRALMFAPQALNLAPLTFDLALLAFELLDQLVAGRRAPSRLHAPVMARLKICTSTNGRIAGAAAAHWKQSPAKQRRGFYVFIPEYQSQVLHGCKLYLSTLREEVVDGVVARIGGESTIEEIRAAGSPNR